MPESQPGIALVERMSPKAMFAVALVAGTVALTNLFAGEAKASTPKIPDCPQTGNDIVIKTYVPATPIEGKDHPVADEINKNDALKTIRMCGTSERAQKFCEQIGAMAQFTVADLKNGTSLTQYTCEQSPSSTTTSQIEDVYSLPVNNGVFEHVPETSAEKTARITNCVEAAENPETKLRFRILNRGKKIAASITRRNLAVVDGENCQDVIGESVTEYHTLRKSGKAFVKNSNSKYLRNLDGGTTTNILNQRFARACLSRGGTGVKQVTRTTVILPLTAISTTLEDGAISTEYTQESRVVTSGKTLRCNGIVTRSRS